MRILYVCDALAIYGGLERVLIDKANWFVQYGDCEVCLLTVNQGDHPICYALHPKVIYVDLNIQFHQQYHFYFLKRFIKNVQLHHLFRKCLKNKIREMTPDIVVCTRLDYIRDILWVKGAVPLIFESHSCCLASYFEGNGMLRRFHVWHLQLAVKKVQMVVALTKGDADEWKKLNSNVCVIPNVVHLNTGDCSDCSTKSVIYVGRFSKQKDMKSLLHIWNQVYQRYPDWHLQIFGGYGDKQNEILSEVKRMDANIQVHHTTSDIMEKYKENSILLLTSQYEPFGLVLPEAMSCGLPVVAFDCPYGPTDIITDGVDGFLVRNRNIKDFVKRICLLIENPKMRVQMGQDGYCSSMRYDIEKIMPLWNSLFASILKMNKNIIM